MIELRELWIDGFGCLRTAREPIRFDKQRVNLFLDDNEAGKTTLQMALLASLFGVEHDKRVRNTARPPAAAWHPLSGPPFGTRLRLADGPRLLELRWNFATDGELRIVDLATNKLVTEELCPGGDQLALGRRLLGLSLEEFLKTCLVRHDDLTGVRDAEGLDSLVQRAADTQAGTSTVAGAQEALRSLLRNYPGVMLKGGGLIENEIRRLDEETTALENRLAELEAERRAIAAQDAEFQRLTAERERLRREDAQLDYLAHVSELDELRHQIGEAEKRRAALAALEAERAKLAGLQAFPADQADPLMQWQVTRLGLLQTAEQAERAIAEQRNNALAPARRELEAMGALANVKQQDVDTLQQLIGKTLDFEAREQRVLDSVAREEAQVATQGAAIEDLDRLEERFAELDPDDGAFLLDHERTVARTVSETAEAKRVALEAAVRSDRILADRRRQQEAGHRSLIAGVIVAAAAAVAGGVLAVLSLSLVLPGIALGVLGLAVGGSLILRGHRTRVAAGSLQGDQLAQAQLERTQAEDRRERLAGERRQVEQRLQSLARRFGYEQAESLVEEYAQFLDLRRVCSTLLQLRSRCPELAAQREEIEADVDARFRAWGLERPASLPLARALTDLQERKARSLHLRRRIEEVNRKINEETERRDVLRRDAEALTAQIRDLFARAGIAQAESVENGIGAFDLLCQQHYRLRHLTDEVLPQARAGVADPKTIDTWRADADRLHRSITTMREEWPGVVSLQAGERSLEYRTRRAAVRAAQEEARAKAEEAGHRVVEILTRYHAERPKLLDLLAERRAQLARARRHAAALEFAANVLEEISHEVHGRWAEELNRSATVFLQRLAPTLSNLRFDSRLSFGVFHKDIPKPISSSLPGPILSSGTWDQVCLAVRLGLADFVARRGQGGLLILDDPFSHYDEARFEAAVRLLGELGRGRHQIVIFSCQRRRFEWLRQRDPGWFNSHITARSIRPNHATGR